MAKALELNNLLLETNERWGETVEGNQLLCCPNADAVATNPRRLVAPLIDKDKACNRMVLLIRAMQNWFGPTKDLIVEQDSQNETKCGRHQTKRFRREDTLILVSS